MLLVRLLLPPHAVRVLHPLLLGAPEQAAERNRCRQGFSLPEGSPLISTPSPQVEGPTGQGEGGPGASCPDLALALFPGVLSPRQLREGPSPRLICLCFLVLAQGLPPEAG